MITQNPIIGKARKKLAGIYSRTQYGKNVVQTCPPPTKGKQTKGQQAVCSAFGRLSSLSNQVSASLLNYIFYQAPNGHSRRAEWNQELSAGMIKVDEEWIFDPSLISQLGTNPKVSESPIILTPTQSQLQINIEQLSHVNNAILEEKPCLILVCAATNQCISLLDNTTLENQTLNIENLSPTYLQKICYIFPLWRVNVGTTKNPIIAFGRFEKNN